MINFCDFIQVFVFTTNHHLKYRKQGNGLRSIAVNHKVQTLSTCIVANFRFFCPCYNVTCTLNSVNYAYNSK